MKSLLLLVILAPGFPDGDAVLLTNARILPVSGSPIPKGYVIIRDGKIVGIAGGEAPADQGRIVDFSGKTIIPGLIHGASALGISGTTNEDGEEVAPNVRILDSFDPRSGDLSRARQSGLTAALVEPGNRGVIGGLASVVKTAGASRSSMILRDEAALKAAMGLAPAQGNFAPRGAAATFFTRRPTTRMGVAWEFRKAFFDAQKAQEPPVLLRALAGTLPVRVSASRVTDIETALQAGEEFHLRIVIEEGQEAYKRAELLAARHIPVLLRPSPPPASSEPEEFRPDAFTILVRAGVATALLPAGDERPEALLTAVALAVHEGASPSEALRAVTLTPAEILGIADRVGSLAPGKDADLVVLSGEPQAVTTRVEKVMINGRWVFGEKADQ
ncbi:MAG TPA: amidohydrolase family protein [Planctomycetota bacterium]|nr:amidohydrolase family protein [Planctomycetota bacterium]